MGRGHEAPPTEIIDVTSDLGSGDTDYDPPLRAVSISATGTLVVDTPSTTNYTLAADVLAAGIQHSIEITKVYQTSTAGKITGWR